MNLKLVRRISLVAAAGLAASGLSAAAATAAPVSRASADSGTIALSVPTTTPIKHVVVIIGENHSFNNVFATYQPPAHQKIWNLLSEGIVNKNGTPGPNFALASQLTAVNTKKYTLMGRQRRHPAGAYLPGQRPDGFLQHGGGRRPHPA